ncbi:MAG TPA: bifunctional lysylphosphatidylglycerol flippase/synthetase MprF, partial [Gemmatirosa sp.]
ASAAGRVRIGGWAFPVPAPRLALSQLVLAAVDWTVAGAVLWALLPHGSDLGAVPFFPFLGAFLLAQFAGVLSHVPGGLGVVETLLVLLLGRYVPAAQVLGALFAYRIVYYLVPFATAVAAFGVYETRVGQHRVALAAARSARVVGRVGPAVVPAALSFATFAAGAVLLVSGPTPSQHTRVAVLHTELPLGVIEFSHLAASLAGAALLVVAWAVRRRLDAAWGLAAALLGVGIVGSLLKGLDYEEAIILALVLAALLPSRKAFYRKAALMSESFTPGWTVAVALVLGISVWLGFFSYKHVEYSNDLWWRFTVRGDAPRFLRATVGAAGGLLLFGLARLLRHAPADPEPPAPADLERAAAIVAAAPNTEANLALLGDKSLRFSARGNAFVMYGVSGRSWVALGDPVGPVEEHAELAWKFKEAADEHGGWPVFYQVSVDHLPLYIDLGLTLLKLGEEARIPLPRFTLDGGARKSMRRIVNSVDKTGVRFEVVGPDQVPALLPELRRVSDAWLASKRVREKGFSLGYFDEPYLRHFPLALIRAPHHDGGDRTGDQIVAFANLWQGADKRELSMDLMRYSPDAPESVMEYLFLQLMLWGKAQGYEEFNLGMAPLSGFESRSLAPLWIRAGALVYQHGENFYNFQGLRRYKEKFDPVWEPRYLASPGGLALPRILANVTALISGGLKGVVAR